MGPARFVLVLEMPIEDEDEDDFDNGPNFNHTRGARSALNPETKLPREHPPEYPFRLRPPRPHHSIKKQKWQKRSVHFATS